LAVVPLTCPYHSNMSDKADSPPNVAVGIRESSPKIDRKVKNFSARLKARAAKEAVREERRANQDGNTSRPESVASTIRPDSVLSFRSEIPNVSTEDWGGWYRLF